MENRWLTYNRWQSDPEFAFAEAERRVATCAESKAERLYLGDVRLDRLPPGIAELTWLRELELYGSPIADFAPLAPLVELRKLTAGSLHGPFPGLDFLRGWRALQILELIAPTPLDLAPLAGCADLARLIVSCSQYPVDLLRLGALADLRALTQLSLSNMRSDRFDVIARWRGLTFVQVTGSNLTTLSGFAQLTELTHLNVSHSAVDDLSPLAGLAHLVSLVVADTAVEDLSPVPRLLAFEELNIARSSVRDLAPLAGHPALRTIDLAGCAVDTFEPLAHCAQLERVDLSDTAVTAITPLHRLPMLRSVRMTGAPVRHLGPRGSLAGLSVLHAPNTPIDDLSALEPAHGLQAIDISYTPVSDLRKLAAARECRTLMLRGTQVADLTPILDTGAQEQDHRYSAQKLDFRDTPAARNDPALAALAAIADTDMGICFAETKRYLAATKADAPPRRRWRLFGAT